MIKLNKKTTDIIVIISFAFLLILLIASPFYFFASKGNKTATKKQKTSEDNSSTKEEDYIEKVYSMIPSVEKEEIIKSENSKNDCIEGFSEIAEGVWYHESYDPDFNYELELVLKEDKSFIYRAFDRDKGGRAKKQRENLGKWRIHKEESRIRLTFPELDDWWLSFLQELDKKDSRIGPYKHNTQEKWVEFDVDVYNPYIKECQYSIDLFDNELDPSPKYLPLCINAECDEQKLIHVNQETGERSIVISNLNKSLNKPEHTFLGMFLLFESELTDYIFFGEAYGDAYENLYRLDHNKRSVEILETSNHYSTNDWRVYHSPNDKNIIVIEGDYNEEVQKFQNQKIGLIDVENDTYSIIYEPLKNESIIQHYYDYPGETDIQWINNKSIKIGIFNKTKNLADEYGVEYRFKEYKTVDI